MAGVRIEQVLALVYARNTVNYLLTRKAYERAISGHFLLNSSLFYKLISELDQPRNHQHAFDTIMEDSTETVVLIKMALPYQNLKINTVSLVQPDTGSNTWTTYKSSKCLFKLREKIIGTFIYMPSIRCLTYLLQHGI